MPSDIALLPLGSQAEAVTILAYFEVQVTEFLPASPSRSSPRGNSQSEVPISTGQSMFRAVSTACPLSADSIRLQANAPGTA